MKSTLAAVKRQRFPSQASQRVRGLFILSLGLECTGVICSPARHANIQKCFAEFVPRLTNFPTAHCPQLVRSFFISFYLSFPRTKDE